MPTYFNSNTLNTSSYSDYNPFGMLMPNRHGQDDDYRYGFNGMESDDEVRNGKGTSYDFGARMLDPRIGRWLSGDPLEYKYPDISTYTFVANSPLIFIDIDGEVIVDPANDRQVEKVNGEWKTIKKIKSDGTKVYGKVSKTFKNDSQKSLDNLSSSKVGRLLIKRMQSISTKVVFDENNAQSKNSPKFSKANSVIHPSETKNSDGLYDYVIITPNWDKIKENSKSDGLVVEEKFLGTILVEFEHFENKFQVDLESRLGDDIYANATNFAEVYNSILNKAIEAEIAYRDEKGIAIDETVFNPILRTQKLEMNGVKVGTELKLNKKNQASYDAIKKKQNEEESIVCKPIFDSNNFLMF